MSARLECRQDFADRLADAEFSIASVDYFPLAGVPIVVDPDLPEHIVWQCVDDDGFVRSCCVEYEGRRYVAVGSLYGYRKEDWWSSGPGS